MSRESEPRGPAGAPKKNLLTWHTLAVAVLAVVVAVASVQELRARSAQRHTRQAVEAAWNAAKAGGGSLNKKDIDQCLRGSPSRQRTKKGEVFTWQGVLQTYHMHLQYRAGGEIHKAIWD